MNRFSSQVQVGVVLNRSANTVSIPMLGKVNGAEASNDTVMGSCRVFFPKCGPGTRLEP